MEFASDVLKHTVEELEPASTYQIKLVAVTANGEQESLAATIDTLVSSCSFLYTAVGLLYD